MKKLYLSITLLGIILLMFAITLIPIQAYTFNGSYYFGDVDLDLALTELNGASLNDLFDYDYLQTIPLIEWNGYRNKFELDGNEVVFNEYVYIDLGYKNKFNNDFIVNGFYVNASGNGYGIVSSSNNNMIRIPIQENTTYTFNFYGTASVNGGVRFEDINKNFISGTDSHFGKNTFTFTSPNNAYFISFSYGASHVNSPQLEYGNISTSYVPYNVLSEIYRIHSTPIVNTDLSQSLLFYNLENMPVDLVNYYFAVFLLNKYNLPIGDLWNYAYTAGTVQGYQDGYYEGQADYHYGYSYSIYDVLESEPYLFGSSVGYNEGIDYAVQENISILSIFELVFGVALNMLTFIITIDIFGISILSLISVLSLFVGVVWILKMIRG